MNDDTYAVPAYHAKSVCGYLASHVAFTPEESTPRRWWVRPHMWLKARRRPSHARYRHMLEEMLRLNRDLGAARLAAHDFEIALIRVRDWNSDLLREKTALASEVAALRQSMETLKRRLEAAAAAVVRSEEETEAARKSLVLVQGERDDLEEEVKKALGRIDALATKLKEKKKR